MEYSFISANSPEELVEMLNGEAHITYLGQPIVHDTKLYQFFLRPHGYTLKKNRAQRVNMPNLTRNNRILGAYKPKRVLTNKQRAAMKAGREAARARKAADMGVARTAAPLSGPLPEESNVILIDWEHDFGTGLKLYKRLDYDGGVYIYDHRTQQYLGVYVEKSNKINKSIPDPLAA
jgi:hypothetical protein